MGRRRPRRRCAHVDSRAQPRSGGIPVAQGVSLGKNVRISSEPRSGDMLDTPFDDAAAPRLRLSVGEVPKAHALGYRDFAAPRLQCLRFVHASSSGNGAPTQRLNPGAHGYRCTGAMSRSTRRSIGAPEQCLDSPAQGYRCREAVIRPTVARATLPRDSDSPYRCTCNAAAKQ